MNVIERPGGVGRSRGPFSRARRAIPLAAATLSSALAGADIITEMTPEAVREAIEWGERAAANDLEQYALVTDATWLVNIDTPFLRIAQLAASTKKQGRALKVPDVAQQVLASHINLYALCRIQASVQSPHVSSIQHVLVVKPGRGIIGDLRAVARTRMPEIIQPTWTTSHMTRARARHDYGPPSLGTSIRAAFSTSAIAPGNEVHIIFEGGLKKVIPLDSQLLSKFR